MTNARRYLDFPNLIIDWPAERVLRISMSRGKVNAMDFDMHRALARIWPVIDDDPAVNAVILAAKGNAFSAGGDFEMEKQVVSDWRFRMAVWKDARDLVQNIMNCSKPIVAAINGAAAGGGLAAAMMCDVTIMAKSAKIVDGHTRLGVAAGDHAAIIWPLLCGMSKAKYYLLTCDPIFGEEAERIGLVTFCVEDDQLEKKSVEVASKLAAAAPSAVRLTKHSLNNWLRAAWPIFDASLALEIVGMDGPEVKEGLSAYLEKRPPKFDHDSSI